MDLITKKQNLDRAMAHINDCLIANTIDKYPEMQKHILNACEEYFAIREEEND